jgi:hypothetical protein
LSIDSNGECNLKTQDDKAQTEAYHHGCHRTQQRRRCCYEGIVADKHLRKASPDMVESPCLETTSSSPVVLAVDTMRMPPHHSGISIDCARGDLVLPNLQTTRSPIKEAPPNWRRPHQHIDHSPSHYPSIPIKTIHHPSSPRQHLQTQMLALPMPVAHTIPTRSQASRQNRIALLILRVIFQTWHLVMPAALPPFHSRNKTKQIWTAIAPIRWTVDFSADDFLRHAAPLGWRE